MKISTKQVAQTGLLLAICIASQFFKNLSVYVTGPIVNAVIILAVLAVGLCSGLILSVLAPITSYFLSASPIIAAIPWVMPMIMLGNCILAICVWFFEKKLRFSIRLPIGLVTGAFLKAGFMTIAIVNILFSLFGNALNEKQMAMGRSMFSITQLVTALTGGLLAYCIFLPLQKFLKNENP